jgi:hypothetical protein
MARDQGTLVGKGLRVHRIRIADGTQPSFTLRQHRLHPGALGEVCRLAGIIVEVEEFWPEADVMNVLPATMPDHEGARD